MGGVGLEQGEVSKLVDWFGVEVACVIQFPSGGFALRLLSAFV